jgi:copper chaperone CopZ
VTTVPTYLVPGISCDTCKNAIEGALREVSDVTRVVVDFAAKTVAVEGAATEETIRSAIGAAGFEVASVVG